MDTMKSLPKIYVRSLAAYNAGIEHGAWIDAAQDEEDALAEIYEVLRGSPVAGAEEWEIVDSKGFFSYDPTGKSLSEICEVALKLEELDESMGELLCLLLDDYDLDCAIERIEDNFFGVYDSKLDYVQQFMQETGAFEGAPEILERFFDYDSYLYDLELSGDVQFYRLGTGEVAVVSAH